MNSLYVLFLSVWELFGLMIWRLLVVSVIIIVCVLFGESVIFVKFCNLWMGVIMELCWCLLNNWIVLVFVWLLVFVIVIDMVILFLLVMVFLDMLSELYVNFV